MTFWELVEQAAREHPDSVAGARRARPDADARRSCATPPNASPPAWASQPGDVVSWQLPTVLESAVVLVALARVGAVQNPIIPLLREQEVRHITGQIGTTLFLVADDAGAVSTTRHGTQRSPRTRGFTGHHRRRDRTPGPQLRLPMGDPATLPPPPTDDHACRWIYYTSGTTSAPKGVRHTDARSSPPSYGVTVGAGHPRRRPISDRVAVHPHRRHHDDRQRAAPRRHPGAFRVVRSRDLRRQGRGGDARPCSAPAFRSSGRSWTRRSGMAASRSIRTCAISSQAVAPRLRKWSGN